MSLLIQGTIRRYLTLTGIILVGKVEGDGGTGLGIVGRDVPVGGVPDGRDNILYVDCVQLQVSCPQELHFALVVLVHTSADQSGC